MNKHLLRTNEVELTDKQLEAISGGSWGGSWGGPWGSSWGGPRNRPSDWHSGGLFGGGYGYPTYPTNQTTRQNTVQQTSTFDAPQYVSNIDSYGGSVTGPSASQTQVSVIS